METEYFFVPGYSLTNYISKPSKAMRRVLLELMVCSGRQVMIRNEEKCGKRRGIKQWKEGRKTKEEVICSVK